MKKINHYKGFTKEDLLSYLELRDGEFYWKVRTSNRVKIGDKAGSIGSYGYKEIRLKGKLLRRSKMAFLCYHGWLPFLPNQYQIDHKNNDILDDKEYNLRIVTKAQNQMNSVSAKGSSSQYKGVCWDKQNNKWLATIRPDGKQKFLGNFTDEIEAAKAYDKAALELFGEYANPNFKETT